MTVGSRAFSAPEREAEDAWRILSSLRRTDRERIDHPGNIGRYLEMLPIVKNGRRQSHLQVVNQLSG